MFFSEHHSFKNIFKIEKNKDIHSPLPIKAEPHLRQYLLLYILAL